MTTKMTFRNVQILQFAYKSSRNWDIIYSDV